MKRKERDCSGNRFGIQNCSNRNYRSSFKPTADSFGTRRTSNDDHLGGLDCCTYHDSRADKSAVSADQTTVSIIVPYGMDKSNWYGADFGCIAQHFKAVQSRLCNYSRNFVLHSGFNHCHDSTYANHKQHYFSGTANICRRYATIIKVNGNCDCRADCKGHLQRRWTDRTGRTSRACNKGIGAIFSTTSISSVASNYFRVAGIAKFLVLLFFVLMGVTTIAFAGANPNEYLPNELTELVEKTNQMQQILSQGPFQLLEFGWQTFSSFVTQPLKVFLRLSIFLMFATIACTPAQTGDKSLASIIEMVCFLLCAILCIQPVQQMIEYTRQQIFYCKGALVGFVPIFSTMLVAGGQPASATIFSGFFLSTALLLAEIAATVVLPFIQMLMALHTAAGICDVSVVSAIAQMVQKIIKWGLGLVSTIFVTFLGLQSFIAGTTDSLAMKTGKFLLSSTIPIVGQAVSGTIGAVSAGIKLARGTAAIGLLIAIGGCFLPVLIQSLLYWWVFSIASTIAKGVEQPKCAALLKAAAGCINLCGITLLFYGLPILLSIVWMMSLGG